MAVDSCTISGGARDLFYVRRPAIQDLIDQILFAHDADDLIDRTATDQELGVRAGAHSVEDLLLGSVEVQPLHARPGSHDRAHWAVGKVENAFDHVALHVVDYPQSGALGDEVVNILLRQGAFKARLEIQQAEEELG